MQERSRSQSPVREKPVPVLGDEEYVKRIKYHNSDFSIPKAAFNRLYIVIQMQEDNLLGERVSIEYMLRPSQLLWVALQCLMTSQRDGDLRHQPQTKKIAKLVFRSMHPTDDKEDAECARWFENLFPKFGPWHQVTWYDQFASMDDTVDGFLLNGVFLMTPALFGQ